MPNSGDVVDLDLGAVDDGKAGAEGPVIRPVAACHAVAPEFVTGHVERVAGAEHGEGDSAVHGRKPFKRASPDFLASEIIGQHTERTQIGIHKLTIGARCGGRGRTEGVAVPWC